jgi:pyruvyltransferase
MDVPVLRELRHRDDIALIDIKSGLKAVADLLYSCERIASSSLHGLILADAYGIPSCWIELSRRIAGGWFKFIDYFCSVGRAVDRPVPLSSSSDLRTIQRSCMCSPMKIDLDRLLACCPFRGR